ncbi:MAG: AAA family ATPase [Polyangiaceae bacterium]|nr:AAA family ATPase [Polyangiaceae bacterium]
MLGLHDYALEAIVHETRDTRIRRATCLASGEHVVIKSPRAGTPSPRTVGRILHEHHILTKLAAVPGLPRVHALERGEGTAALVLYDAGLDPLSRILAERGRLPVDAALRVAMQLCDVLHAVHTAGVVHKDVKPANVLVDESCAQLVLVDFGIATELLQEATEPRLVESLEGTLAYISPEQTGRTARSVDARTDLYSLGVTLFEMLSGRRPFELSDPLALVYAHLATIPPAVDAVAPDVPPAVSAIVAKLLMKEPEWRYQTAHGVAKDLGYALSQWRVHGRVRPFALGASDFSPVLQLPEALVGREAEHRILMHAFDRAAGGSVELLLVGGPSGVGKTTLIRSVYREIAKAGRGMLLSGKHDKLGRSAPYGALTRAFSALFCDLAASPGPTFDAWRERLNRALAGNARVIAELVPELEWLLGPLPPVPAVPTEMALDRLKRRWTEIAGAVTDASPPLVLFLDDMQWVDPASLDLLQGILTDASSRHQLVIAAYRDNEVDAAHPLWRFVDAVSERGVPVRSLRVEPLTEASLGEWLTLALSASPARVEPLAAALFRKTLGNPFFVVQLVQELYRQKRLIRDLEDGSWQWDQDAVERAPATENVLSLMQSKVLELPASTRDLLGQAACGSYRFSLRELMALSGRRQADAVRQLWPAVTAGLLVANDSSYRETHALATAHQTRIPDVRYRFLHDRVQDAFYAQIAPEQRAKTHLAIGRRLQILFRKEGGSNQKQLEMARHLNLGATALTTAVERRDLARTNLMAAKAARENASYELQARLVEQGESLLGADAWEKDPALSAELALEHLEADYMLHAFADLHARAEKLLEQPLSPLSRLAAQEVRVRACFTGGRYEEGQRIGLGALAERGIEYPDGDTTCITQALEHVQACDGWFNDHPHGFESMPADASQEHWLCDALEAATMQCASIGRRPSLTAFAAARNVRQTIRRGALSSIGPLFLGIFSHMRSSLLEQYRGDLRWAREAEKAAQRLESPYLPECSALVGHYTPYEAPVEESREHYRDCLRVATASGSSRGISWAISNELYHVDLWGGRPLPSVAEKISEHREWMTRSGGSFTQSIFSLADSYVSLLRVARRPRPADRDWLSKGSRAFAEAGNEKIAEAARVLEAHLFLAFGEYRRALDRAAEAERFRLTLNGVPPVTDIPLWHGLAAAKCCASTCSERERAALSSTLARGIQRFRYLTDGCRQNFGHKLRLLEAEQRRIQGATDDAVVAYDEAIAQARHEGFLHVEALAAQFCAELQRETGRDRSADVYLDMALDAYRRWGALAIVAHLEALNPKRTSATRLAPPAASLADSTTTTDAEPGGVVLDLDFVTRSARAVASEREPNGVVARLMQLVEENTGAQRAVLLLAHDGSLVVVADSTGRRVHSGGGEPLSPAHPVSRSVVEYVLRTRETVVLGDAPADSRFGADVRFRESGAHSVLAAPLVQREGALGVLYLEHDAANAFSPARAVLVESLAGTAAIALENLGLRRG